MFDVVGVGCCCFDLLGVVPHLPGLDEEIEMLETSQQGGGEVATALVALARLGCSATYAGKIGSDPIGSVIRQEFEDYGVDTSHLVVEPGAVSQAAVVLVDRDSGQRSIVACVPTFAPLEPSQIASGLIEGARYLHLDGVHRQAAVAAARRARAAGVTVVLDADVTALDDDIGDLIALTDIVIASRPFATGFSGTEAPEEAVHFLRARGPSVAAVTLGDQGCVCCGTTHLWRAPAFAVDVVDTTGAGDVFHGAFICGLLQDWELEKAVEFAAAVAALKCTRLGGRAGIPSFEEALQFLSDRGASHFS